jgi:glutamate-1-semialdehyde aminotransferase
MATTGVKAPQALAETRRWAAPGSRSAALFAQAQGVMPGGNTRTTVYMAPYPPYAASGDGCWITDVEGDRRLDCLNNYTALIHGHAHPAIVEAATRRLALGSSFPLPTPEEVELAALLCERLPSAERVRFTNSGSEAVMMAIKGARAWTGRPKIAKFEGAYHGSYDYAEVSLASSPESWGSLASPASTPYSKGVPPAVLDDVVVLPFNHAELAVARIEREARHLAAVLVDPIPNRVGLIPAQREFLRALREITSRHGIALIFDEVITFRVGYHGAQGVFGVTPDLTTLGKIIGGGFPVGAVVGRADRRQAGGAARRHLQRQPGHDGRRPGRDAAAHARGLRQAGRAGREAAGEPRGLLQALGRAGRRHRPRLAVPPASDRSRAGRLPQHPHQPRGGGAPAPHGARAHGARRADVHHRPRLPLHPDGRHRAGEPGRDVRGGAGRRERRPLIPSDP